MRNLYYLPQLPQSVALQPEQLLPLTDELEPPASFT
jgi:hypothetical protein